MSSFHIHYTYGESLGLVTKIECGISICISLESNTYSQLERNKIASTIANLPTSKTIIIDKTPIYQSLFEQALYEESLYKTFSNITFGSLDCPN
jgi:hypothetical protein